MSKLNSLIFCSSPKNVFVVPGEEFGAGLKFLIRGNMQPLAMERLVVLALIEFIVSKVAKIHLINPLLLGEKCKPIIICDADEGFHLFTETISLSLFLHLICLYISSFLSLA